MLVALLIAPFAAAVITMLGSSKDRGATLRLAVTLSLVIVGLGVGALAAAPGTIVKPWFTLPGTDAVVHGAFGFDGMSVWLVQLATVLGAVALIGGINAAGDRLREYAAAVFAAQGCLIGLFLTDDLVGFYLFFEAMLVPMVVIIAMLGDGDRRIAVQRFFLYTMLGSVPFLVAIWYLAAATGTTSLVELPAAIEQLGPRARWLCFAAFALAFSVKTPLVPFHGWQAPVYASAPGAAVVLLGGAMAKAGTYGFLALLVPLFPGEAAQSAWLFLTLGIISVWWGGLLALAATDIKRLLAYSSLSHLGLVVVGTFAFSADAASGAVVQMLAHGLAVAALFLVVGYLEERRGSRSMGDFGGVVAKAPLLVVLLVGGALVSSALPGTLSFVGEFLLLAGTFQGLEAIYGAGAATVLTLLAGASVVIGVVYTLRMVQRVAFGEAPSDDDAVVSELSPREAVAVVPVLILSVVLGMAAAPITTTAGSQAGTLIEPAASAATAPLAQPATGEETADAR